METGSVADQGAGDGSAYVFGAGSGLGAEQFDGLKNAVAEASLPLGHAWSALFLRELEIKLVSVSAGPVPVEEGDGTGPLWLAGVGGEGPFWSLVDLGNGFGAAALVIPSTLGLLSVDILLGGSGRSTGERALSTIDADLLTTLVSPTFEALLTAVGDESTTPSPRALIDLDEPDIVELLGTCVTAEFCVIIDEVESPFLMVLSETAATAILGGTSLDFAAAEHQADTRRALESVLAQVPIEAVIAFPTIDVASRTVLGLDIGDVVSLGYSTDALLSLTVDGVPLGTVRPARSGSGLSCQVVTTVHSVSSLSGGVL